MKTKPSKFFNKDIGDGSGTKIRRNPVVGIVAVLLALLVAAFAGFQLTQETTANAAGTGSSDMVNIIYIATSDGTSTGTVLSTTATEAVQDFSSGAMTLDIGPTGTVSQIDCMEQAQTTPDKVPYTPSLTPSAAGFGWKLDDDGNVIIGSAYAGKSLTVYVYGQENDFSYRPIYEHFILDTTDVSQTISTTDPDFPMIEAGGTKYYYIESIDIDKQINAAYAIQPLHGGTGYYSSYNYDIHVYQLAGTNRIELTQGTHYYLIDNYKIVMNTSFAYTPIAVDVVATAKIIPDDSPIRPVMAERSTNSITLVSVSGYEYYCAETDTWQSSPAFTGLSSGQRYTFQQRKIGTSAVSSRVVITTDSTQGTAGWVSPYSVGQSFSGQVTVLSYEHYQDHGLRTSFYFQIHDSSVPELNGRELTGSCISPGVTTTTGTHPCTITVTGVDTNSATVSFYVQCNAMPEQQDFVATTTVSFSNPGYIDIDKDSSNPEISDDNPCYDLSTAIYSVYTDSACTDQVSQIALDSNGYGMSGQLSAGTYYVKETQAGTSYTLDQTVYSVSVSTGEVSRVHCATSAEHVYDTPQNDPFSGIIQKYDAETNTSVPLGGAMLAGAQFTVKYYAGQYATVAEAEASGFPERTWVFATDEYGYFSISEEYLVSGDELYHSLSGATTGPIGTYIIQETKAPTGYLINSTQNIRHVTAEPNSTVEAVKTLQPISISDQVKRNDLSFTKKNDDTGERMGFVPFVMTSKTTGESHIIVTDANGIFSSSASSKLHTEKTNANDACVSYDETTGLYTVTDESQLDPTAGVWFGLDTDPDDRRGAFPYDEYELLELPCTANANTTLRMFTITVHDNDGAIIDYGTVDDHDVVINTVLRTSDGDEETFFPIEGLTLIDTVEYMKLVSGDEYVLTAQIMDKTTGSFVEIDGNPLTASTTFIAPSGGIGTIDVTFPAIDATSLLGHEIVCYETLYHRGYEESSHRDINDIDQTLVSVTPEIHTMATDKIDGDQIIESDPNIVIVDTIYYDNLIPGKEFTFKTVLMDKAKNVPATDSQGNAIEAITKITPESKTGTVDVELAFDSTTMEDGTELVIYEYCYYGEQLMASHENIDDRMQTVSIKTPVIGTMALDKSTNNQITFAGTEATIIDTVSYENLIPGYEYVITGKLVEKETVEPKIEDDEEDTANTNANANTVENENTSDEQIFPSIAENENANDNAAIEEDNKSDEEATGENEEGQGTEEPQEITATATFVADESGSGSVAVEFTFDASKLDGTTFVVFEQVSRVYNEKTYLIASHEDIDDEAQTIYIPAIATLAHGSDGISSKNLLGSPNTKVIDTIAYANLIPGKEYTIKSALINKETGDTLKSGDSDAVGTSTFTPEESAGNIDVEFVLDSTHYGKVTAVAYEKIYLSADEESEVPETIVASHEDIEDAAQTVTITGDGGVASDEINVSQSSSTTISKTGDIIPYIAIALVVAGICGAYIIRNRKRR